MFSGISMPSRWIHLHQTDHQIKPLLWIKHLQEVCIKIIRKPSRLMHMGEIFLNCAPNFDSKFSAEKLDPICLNPRAKWPVQRGLSLVPMGWSKLGLASYPLDRMPVLCNTLPSLACPVRVPGFHSMKGLGVILLPPGLDSSPLQYSSPPSA